MSLGARMALLFSVLLAAIGVFMLAFFPARMATQAQTDAEERATSLGQVMSTALGPAVEFDDPDNAVSLLQWLAATHDARFGLVRRADGKMVFLRDVAHVPAHSVRAWTGSELPEARAPPEDWPTRFSWPDALVPELEHALGSEAALFAAACNVPAPITVRANRLRLDRDALGERLQAEGVASHPARYASDALHLEGRPNVLGLAAHQEGLFDIQDEGSQLAGALVDARPGMRVLDLCAGAGGKTLLLAAALQGEGRVDAYDIDREALERLRHRAERAGVAATVRILQGAPEESYDAVLVDAPCSALGSIRRGPDVRWRTDVASFARWPPIQRALLETALARVRPGGRIVYVTCTIRPEENEDVVDAFLEAHPELAQLEAPVAAELRRGPALVTSPHRHGMDGFYGAALTRR